MKRRFAIPVVALGAGTTACMEAIEGSWDITQAAGETLPYVYEYGGTTYTLQSTLNVQEERVSLNTITSYVYEDNSVAGDTTVVSGTMVTKSERRSYGITFTQGGDEWTWDCGMPSSKELSCTDSDGESWKARPWPIDLEGI